MITFNMSLLPYGQGIGRSDVMFGLIWTTDDGKHHCYNFTDPEGNSLLSGKVTKEFSGHKNPVELLRRILKC